MKSTGVVRKLDALGRIVIPMELRKTHEIGEHDPLEMYVEGENIILKKYKQSCALCSKANNVIEFKDKLICDECLELLKKL